MTISPVEMETILNYLVAKLPEEQLAELDDLRAGVSRPEAESAPAMDSSIEGKRRQWLGLSPKARIAVRNARTTRMAADAAGATDYAARFPNSNRLKG